MNDETIHVVLVKEIKDVKTGVKDNRPWTKTYFIGVVDEGKELGISTFNPVEPQKLYEMTLKSRIYNNKTYYNADVKGEFTAETKPTPPPQAEDPKPPPPPAPKPASTYANDAVGIRETALKCSITSFTIPNATKKSPAVTDKDIIATAHRFEHYIKTGKWLDE